MLDANGLKVNEELRHARFDENRKLIDRATIEAGPKLVGGLPNQGAAEHKA